MSYQSDNLDLEILEVGDPADLTTVSDNFEKIDAVVGDIATFETSPTKAAHSAGEFLLYEGRLYKVTAAISAGGSLILGTNVQAANIGSEIKSILDSSSRETWDDNTAGVHITKIGKVCYLTYISPSRVTGSGSGVNTVITTLPTGWRPAYEYATPCIVGTAVYILTVAVNGTLNIYSMPDSSSGWPRASVAYVAP